MISRRELLDAISEIENSGNTLRNCEKLSALYSIYDHCFCEDLPYARSVERVSETVVDFDAVSEFAECVNGKNAADVWRIMEEEMEAVKILQPRLYDATLTKIRSLS